jgi:chemosensory pili system protein ChpC
MTADTLVTELSCILLPVAGGALLLPAVTAAEVVAGRRLVDVDGSPEWCAGTFAWRGVTVPVVRFSVLNERAVNERGRCIVVCNRVRHRQGIRFYGLMADGMPRLLRLSAADIENHRTALGTAEVAAVRIGTEVAAVPNLTLLEDAVASLTLPAHEPA